METNKVLLIIIIIIILPYSVILLLLSRVAYFLSFSLLLYSFLLPFREREELIVMTLQFPTKSTFVSR
jgi:Mn2+/Fe2+ NRAMP family transporter